MSGKKRSKLFRERQKVKKSKQNHFNNSTLESDSNLSKRATEKSEESQIENISVCNLGESTVINTNLQLQVNSGTDAASFASEIRLRDTTVPLGWNNKSEEEKEIEEIKNWIVQNNIAHVHADKLLNILRRRLLPALPKNTKTLLESNLKIVTEVMEVSNGSFGEFVHLGIKRKLEETVNTDLHPTNVLELIINIDGLSPFKSSPLSIWPTLCKVYTKEDIYEPFTVCVFSGNGKPKNSNEYLKKFVQELQQLLQNGLYLNNKHFQLKIKVFVCDTPARSFIKCVVGHASFSGCERCAVVGRKEQKVTVFLDTEAEEKTDDDFRQFKYPQCHTGISILSVIEPSINMVSQFVLDPMHLIYLGCTKRILDYLLLSSTHKVRLSAGLKKELLKRTMEIYKDIPEEFPRKMRPSNDHSKYKAVEYKFFLLYAAPFILKKLVSDDIYNHILLLCVSCRLLSEKNPENHLTQVREYLKSFVDKAAGIYGLTFMSLNIHNLIHICDDVQNTKCNLSELSAFCFESYLGTIRNVLRSPRHIIPQYCRRLYEKEMYSKTSINASKNLIILKKVKTSIVQLKFYGMILGTQHPNNTVLMKNGSIAVINQFVNLNDRIYVNICKYLKKQPVFTHPVNSSTLNIWNVSQLSENIEQLPLDSIQQKFVKFSMKFFDNEENKFFVVPLLH